MFIFNNINCALNYYKKDGGQLDPVGEDQPQFQNLNECLKNGINGKIIMTIIFT